MQPRRFELPQVLRVENGRATISPGNWEGDDGVKATGTVVSVRKVTDATGNPAGWPIVHGATEIPPPSTPRTGHGLRGFYDGDPIVLPPMPLGAGRYRLELWRGSATTDGNYPGSPPIWEWGREASDFGPSNAVVFFDVAGSPPPPPEPSGPTGDELARRGFADLQRAVVYWAENGVKPGEIEATRAWIALRMKLLPKDSPKLAEIRRLLS